MSQHDGIEVRRVDGVATISIDRPAARNALDGRAVAALRAAFEAVNADPQTAVGVLHGRHGSFCAGADLKEMAAGAHYEAWAGSASGMLGAPLDKPLIAAVEGHAVAGGLGLALYCDIRVADATAVFGVFCRRFGVPMSDGTPVRLPRLIGEARAMEMLLTGRAVTADEALQFGLVAEVVPAGTALQRAQALAAMLRDFPGRAPRSDRRAVLECRDLGLDAALRHEASLAEAAKQLDAAAGAGRFTAGAGRHGEKEGG